MFFFVVSLECVTCPVLSLLIFFFFFNILQLAEERKLMEDAETKFLQLDRVESDSLSKGKPKGSGGTGSLLDEVKTANGTSSTPYVRGEKMEYETSAPRSRSEMDSLKLPPIILPPSFRRKASSASVRSEVSESAQAQPAVRRSYSFPREEAKRSHSTISNGVVREVQARDSHTDKGFAKPRIRVSSNISGQARQEKSGNRKSLPFWSISYTSQYLIASDFFYCRVQWK